ncbi:inner membrane CreD family protein [Paramuribaculum intestinale]|uniref:inner membrane CreD family protein n=1 Tax=Paramuribaculum intestinale TaxID=2094151 RepID=UPI0023A90EF3|nr:inner membrane CreD family protein [Paramuribaculum intestinale]
MDTMNDFDNRPMPPLPATKVSVPRHTTAWLGVQTLVIAVFSAIIALIADGIGDYGAERQSQGLLSESSSLMVSDSASYCFALIAISLISITLIEVAFRKYVNYLQYALIGCALGLFYLMLLALAEFVPFWAAYGIVTVITAGLITLFVKGITANVKAAGLTAGILVVEYAVILILIYIGSLALLIGSILLFVIIALAMYFTLRMRQTADGELIIK